MASYVQGLVETLFNEVNEEMRATDLWKAVQSSYTACESATDQDACWQLFPACTWDATARQCTPSTPFSGVILTAFDHLCSTYEHVSVPILFLEYALLEPAYRRAVRARFRDADYVTLGLLHKELAAGLRIPFPPRGDQYLLEYANRCLRDKTFHNGIHVTGYVQHPVLFPLFIFLGLYFLVVVRDVSSGLRNSFNTLCLQALADDRIQSALSNGTTTLAELLQGEKFLLLGDDVQTASTSASASAYEPSGVAAALVEGVYAIVQGWFVHVHANLEEEERLYAEELEVQMRETRQARSREELEALVARYGAFKKSTGRKRLLTEALEDYQAIVDRYASDPDLGEKAWKAVTSAVVTSSVRPVPRIDMTLSEKRAGVERSYGIRLREGEVRIVDSNIRLFLTPKYLYEGAPSVHVVELLHDCVQSFVRSANSAVLRVMETNPFLYTPVLLVSVPTIRECASHGNDGTLVFNLNGSTCASELVMYHEMMHALNSVTTFRNNYFVSDSLGRVDLTEVFEAHYERLMQKRKFMREVLSFASQHPGYYPYFMTNFCELSSEYFASHVARNQATRREYQLKGYELLFHKTAEGIMQADYAALFPGFSKEFGLS